MKYQLAYKCALCGKIITFGSFEVSRDSLTELCGEVIEHQGFLNGSAFCRAHLHIPCQCPDGDRGIAYFAGFKLYEEGQENDIR